MVQCRDDICQVMISVLFPPEMMLGIQGKEVHLFSLPAFSSVQKICMTSVSGIYSLYMFVVINDVIIGNVSLILYIYLFQLLFYSLCT